MEEERGKEEEGGRYEVEIENVSRERVREEGYEGKREIEEAKERQGIWRKREEH